MTYMDKLRKEHPEDVSPEGYPTFCPNHYGYTNESAYGACPAERLEVKNCLDCWNREAPEDKPLTERIAESAKKVADSAIKAAKTLMDADIPSILDSGERREFETGAVRDIQDGKGRCDLMPLDVVAAYIHEDNQSTDWVLASIANFQQTGHEHYLYGSLASFEDRYEGDCYTMLLEASKHFEDGAKKYGEWNWQKGIPVRCYIDSAVRHYLKWLRGDADEPHDRAFVWNILCCIWTCIHKPELNDYAHKTGG